MSLRLLIFNLFIKLVLVSNLQSVCKMDHSDHVFMVNIPWLQWADNKQIKEVILHETAHLLVGTRQGHNSIWRDVYMFIGGNGRSFIDFAEVTYDNLARMELPEDWRTLRYGIDIKYWQQLIAMLDQRKTGIRLYAELVGTGPVLQGRGHYDRLLSTLINILSSTFHGKLNEVKEHMHNLHRLALYYESFINNLEREYDLDDKDFPDNERLDNNSYVTMREARQLRRAKKSLLRFINLLEKRFGDLI